MADYKTLYCEKAKVDCVESTNSEKTEYHVGLITDTGRIDSYFSKPIPNGVSLGSMCNPNLVTTDSRNGDEEYTVEKLKKGDLYTVELKSSTGKRVVLSTSSEKVIKNFKFGDKLYGNLDFIKS